MDGDLRGDNTGNDALSTLYHCGRSLVTRAFDGQNQAGLTHVSIVVDMASTRARGTAAQIVAQLRAAGHLAYFVGGCVRDLLLGRDPKDFDVATSALPEQVLSMFPKTFAVGAHFGVVLVCTQEEEEIVTEVATFRSDGVY